MDMRESYEKTEALRRYSAHLLLEVLKELIEGDLYGSFEDHVGGCGNLPFYFCMRIVVKIGACSIIGQIYDAGGFD